ncbi:MAG: response regulator [Pseudomonadota bacterium]
MKTLTLERKVLAGFLASLVTLIILAGLTWQSSRESVDAGDFVVHTHEAIASIAAIESLFYRAESSQRAYLLLGTPNYVKNRDAALAQLDNELLRITSLTFDNPLQQNRIAELKREIASRIENFSHFEALRDTKGMAVMLEEYRTTPAGNPTQTISRLRILTEEMKTEEQKLLKQRQALEHDRTQLAQAGFLALLTLLAVALPMLYFRIIHDLGEREKSRRAMLQLTDILDSTPDIVCMADAGGRTTYMNQAARLQLGVGPEDPSHFTIQSHHPAWAFEHVKNVGIPAAIESGSWSGDSAFLSRDGREIHVSQVIISHPQPDGTIALSTIARSTAERRKAEQLMQQAAKYDVSNAQALTLYNAETERHAILEGTLAILADNHAFPVSAFYGYQEWGGTLRLDAARGAPAGTRTLINMGEGLVGEAAQSRRVIHIDSPGPEMDELPIQTGFTDIVPAALVFCPVTYREHLLGVMTLAATASLSERDRSFIALLSTQLGSALHNIKQLEDMKLLAGQLRGRSEEIALKNKQLEENSRMKSEFLANMSHELRTPLNAIIGFSEVIRDGMAGPINAEQKEYASDILSSGQHLLSLINDILDLSKIESGHMTLDLDLTDAASLAASGIAVLREKAMAHQIALRQNVQPGMERLCLDMRKTKQIIFNLLSNAVKFTPDGGAVDLTLRCVARAEIERWREVPGSRLFPLQDRHFDQFLEISVSDTGIGVAPDNLLRLFEPFTQIDSSHSRKYEGTGLGLVMVRRLAELHRGSVLARSTPGKGSTFTVWLPWRHPDVDDETQAIPVQATTAAIGSEEPLVPTEPDTPMLAPLLLLVEDEPRAAKLIRVQLEDEGYRVVHAPNAEQGLKLAAELQPDAIILDIILPGIDGWEMLTQVKRTASIASIPVVIVSITDDASRGFALGASQVLTKPVVQEDLMAALASLGVIPVQGQQVLVVDDDPKAVSLISIHLKAAGFDPVGAYGGKEAIEWAINKKPALLILDLMMPEITGFDVVQALHAQPETAATPILVLTAKMLTREDRDKLTGKVQRILEKSDYSPKILLSEVKRALLRNKKLEDVL